MFTQQFGKYACDGDTITCEVDGFIATATIHRDENGVSPEQRCDGFWPSLDPKAWGYIGAKSKRTLRREMAKAKAILAAWENDEWYYCGIAVTIARNGVQLTGEFGQALWGIECNYPGTKNEYLVTVANELLGEALIQARQTIATLNANEVR